MTQEIKIRLLKLDKKQVDLIKVLHKRGFPNLNKCQLSDYINEVQVTPQAKAVIKEVLLILDEWEKEA